MAKIKLGNIIYEGSARNEKQNKAVDDMRRQLEAIFEQLEQKEKCKEENSPDEAAANTYRGPPGQLLIQ